MNWECGEKYLVRQLTGDNSIVERLRELGFTTGAEFTIANITSFGDPVVVKIRAAFVALRRRELECIVKA